MLSANEVSSIREEFGRALKAGNGLITLDGLTTVFQDLGDWSKDDLATIFHEVDVAKTGSVNFADLLDWILKDDEDEADVMAKATAPNGEFIEDSEIDDAEVVADVHDLIDIEGVDLTVKLNPEEVKMVTAQYGMDETEAKLIYKQESRLLEWKGVDISEGIEVAHFIDDLQVNAEDKEACLKLKGVLADVKAQVARGEKYVPAGFSYVLPTAVDRACLILQRTGKKPEDVISMVESREISLSTAGTQSILDFKDKPAEMVDMVKEYLVNPPLLPATAGQAANAEVCSNKIDKLIEKCRAAGTKFTDDEWDLTKDMAAVLYVDKTGPGYDCTVGKPAGVKRMTELVENPVLFKGGIAAGDVVQGQVGTCFMLGAVAAIAANNSKAIEKVFIDYNTELGIYGVRFNVHGEWTHVIIDDYMPVDEYGRLMYARGSDPQETWVPLLEKAYCKLHTCYEMCDGGRPSEAVFSMSGGVSGKLKIDKKHLAAPASYFALVQNALAQGWLLTTTFKMTGAGTSAGKCGEAVLPTGLVGGHVYSVLKVVEANGQQLVCCRNPWGTGEWQGKWSDANAEGEWTDAMKEATGYLGLNDGKFWMSVEDFVANSGGCEYARVFGPQWKKITSHGHFRTGPVKAVSSWAYTGASADELTMAKGATIEVETMSPGWWFGNVAGEEAKGYFPANYVKLSERAVARYDLTATPADSSSKQVTVVVMLMQPNVKFARKYFKRKQDGKNYKDLTYPKLELIVLGADGSTLLKREGQKRCVSSELHLDAGVPVKVYAFSPNGEGAAFSVRAYVKEGDLNLKKVEGAKIDEVAVALST